MEKDYSINWKDFNNILFYKPKFYEYHNSVILLELDDCLIDNMRNNWLYDTMNKKNIKINENLIKCLNKLSNYSIVVLSNQLDNSKLNLDIIKRKFEQVLDHIKFPILGLFALKPNCYSKPHTRLFKILEGYFKQYGSINIQKKIVVSNEGGIIVEKARKNGDVQSNIPYSDVDRAFAWNINADYNTVEEFITNYSIHNRLEIIDKKSIKFQWDSNIIDPDTRIMYDVELSKQEQINIFKELGGLGSVDVYVIIICGPPRCGKTTLARQLIAKWRASEFGKKNEIKRLGPDKFTKSKLFTMFKKYTADRISVILDGCCETDRLREPFLSFLKERSVGLLLVEICVGGIELAKLFNHVCVEESKDPDVLLYKNRDFYIYKSQYKKPRLPFGKHVTYYPRIEKRDSVMLYRY